MCSGLLLILVTAVSERDPFPWEDDVEGESDDAEFRGHYSHDTHTIGYVTISLPSALLLPYYPLCHSY